MNRELWFTLCCADEMLKDVYRAARAEGEWSIAANAQACRARFVRSIGEWRDVYNPPDSGQLAFIPEAQGRAHDAQGQ